MSSILISTLCTFRKLNKMPGHNVLCCAARRSATGKVLQMQQVSFLLLYRIFPSFPHAREKSGMSLEKHGTEGKIWSQVRDRWAGAGWECLAGMGAGAGAGGVGRACSYIKTCVGIGLNAVSELNTEGKIRYFLPDFSREVPDISIVFPDFSRGINLANSRGKSGAITDYHQTAQQLQKFRWMHAKSLETISDMIPI